MEKNANGDGVEYGPWLSTAPTATSEASVVRAKAASGFGCASITASESADFAAAKAETWSADHDKDAFWVGTEEVRACRGAKIAAR